MSLGLPQNLCQFYNLHTCLYHSWNLGRDWFSSCWDIRWDRPIFAVSTPANFFRLKLGITNPNLTKFLHDVQKWLPIKLLKSKLWYSNPFPNLSMPNKRKLWNFGRVVAQFSHSTHTGSIFTIFSGNVQQLVELLMHVSARRWCISFQNTRAKSEDSQFWRLQKSPKINWLP